MSAKIALMGTHVKMSEPEALLRLQLLCLPLKFEQEFKAIPGRNFRFDFLVNNEPCELLKNYVSLRVLVEIQGGVWKKMAHSTGTGITRDCEKLSLAAAQGYRVIVCTPAQVKNGQALSWIEQALGLIGPAES